MLKTLSYFNLLFSVGYFLEYLQNANPIEVAGLLCLVVLNWLTLVNLEREQFKWKVFQWILAMISLSFTVFIGYGAVQLLIDATEHGYYPGSTVLLIISSLIFVLSILLHLFLSWLKNSVKKDH